MHGAGARVARSVAWTVAERGAATRNGACSLRDFEGTSGMIRHLRRVEVWSLLLLALLAAGRADAMCNAIPTADRTFSSAAGAVDRPFASPGRQVKLMLGAVRRPRALRARARSDEGGAHVRVLRSRGAASHRGAAAGEHRHHDDQRARVRVSRHRRAHGPTLHRARHHPGDRGRPGGRVDRRARDA